MWTSSYRNKLRPTVQYTMGMEFLGYHVYKDVWNASTGQILHCQQERGKICMLLPWSGDVLLLDRCLVQYRQCVPCFS